MDKIGNSSERGCESFEEGHPKKGKTLRKKPIIQSKQRLAWTLCKQKHWTKARLSTGNDIFKAQGVRWLYFHKLFYYCSWSTNHPKGFREVEGEKRTYQCPDKVHLLRGVMIIHWILTFYLSNYHNMRKTQNQWWLP